MSGIRNHQERTFCKYIYIFNGRFWLQLIDISDLYVKTYLQFNLYRYKIVFTFTIIIALNIPPFYVNVHFTKFRNLRSFNGA